MNPDPILPCKACDKILKGADWLFDEPTQQYDELCYICRNCSLEDEDYESTNIVSEITFKISTTQH